MMRAERGASRNTISAYAADLREMSGFLATHGSAFLSCSRQSLEAFFADRAENGLAANSAARKLSCLKRFTQFLVAEGLRADDPARLIDAAKARRSLPATLSIAEVDLLLNAAHEVPAPATEGARRRALRLACLLELLYGTGLRVSELVSLPLAALRGDRMMLTVKGKGGRERILPLNRKARDILDAWLDAARPAEGAAAPSKWLFPSWGEEGHRRARNSRATSKRLERGSASTRSGYRHMSCATPSRPTSSTAASICACCRRCLGTPTSPRRKYTPTSWKTACARLCSIFIR